MFMEPQSIQLVRDNTGPGNIRAFREQYATHGADLRVVVPFLVGSWDEFSLGVPSGNPGVPVIKTEEQESLRFSTFMDSHRMPAASVLQLIFEHVPVKDSAVNKWDGNFFFVFIAILVYKVPSTTRDVFVNAGNRGLPMFFFINGPLDALSTLKPVRGAADSSEAKEKVGRHDELNLVVIVIHQGR
jgi:hypothetical protein